MKRSTESKLLGGVCAGIGENYGIDPLFVRLAFAIAFLMWGVGLLAYCLLWLLMD